MATIDLSSNGPTTAGTLDHALMKEASAIFLVQSAFGAGAEVTAPVTGSISYYKRGYNAALHSYEHWRTGVREDGPPSGASLLDVTVVAEVRCLV